MAAQMSRLPSTGGARMLRRGLSSTMKVAIVILILAAVGLGVGLMYRHNEAVKVKMADEEIKSVLSNKVEQTQAKLDEEQKVNLQLGTILNLKGEELSSTSNTLAKVNADLARTQKEMQAAGDAAKAEIERRDNQIAQLTSQTNALTIKMDDLTSNIDKLGKQISDTERKLSASEGDRDFLVKELRRMQTEKAELERQFNDLAILRTQISKLKEEMSIARRLEWIKMGIYGTQGKKGAEALITRSTPTLTNTNNFDLNVELRQDGGATVAPPTTPPPAPVQK
jgi:septal ring factor EnvC (AmiA/AmiB activator)